MSPVRNDAWRGPGWLFLKNGITVAFANEFASEFLFAHNNATRIISDREPTCALHSRHAGCWVKTPVRANACIRVRRCVKGERTCGERRQFDARYIKALSTFQSHFLAILDATQRIARPRLRASP